MFENFKVPANLVPSDPRFGVGPSLIPMGHLEKLAETGHKLLGTSHRQSFVKNLVKEVQEGFQKYYNLPAGYQVVIGNGGATFLFDMIGLGLVEKKSIHYTCGEFSNKWFKSHEMIPWIEAKEVQADVGHGIEVGYESGYDMVCATLNETSTGVMITDVPDLKDQDVLVCVDATSGAGQIPLDINKVDVYFFSPQKVFASEGGTFIALMSPKAINRAKKIAKMGRYIPEIMNWVQAIDNSEKNQTYNTPSVTTLFLLNEQLKTMNALGHNTVIKMAQDKAKMIYDWADASPYLSCYVQDKKHRSLAVATIDLDDKYNATDLTKVLRAQHAVYDIDAYRKLGRNQFRIALFHNVTRENLKKLMDIIDLAVKSA